MTEPEANSAHGLLDPDFNRDRFLAILVHELRNPLAPIQNAVEVLKLSRPVSDRVD
ncbi:MAG: histidine kinase dimerization/phospho-acceptor domain-containing protein, partial [Gemmatimonadota bacterium]